MYFVSKNLVYYLRISEHIYKRESTVNLLLISDDTKQDYCFIKDISKLLSLRTPKHGHAWYVCFWCLNTFNSEESLESHHEYCKSYEAIQIELPKRDRQYFFINHNRSKLVRFSVYTDFESFTPQLSTCQPNREKNYTKQYQKYITSGFCYHIKCFNDTLYSQ